MRKFWDFFRTHWPQDEKREEALGILEGSWDLREEHQVCLAKGSLTALGTRCPAALGPLSLPALNSCSTCRHEAISTVINYKQDSA